MKLFYPDKFKIFLNCILSKFIGHVLILTFMFWMSGVFTIWAASPSSFELSYNADQKILILQGHHPTQDRTEHFIRRAQVTVNQNEPQNFYFVRQASMQQFKESLNMELKPSDSIHVVIYCNEGGKREAILQIPDEKKEIANQQIDLKKVRDQEHQQTTIVP